MRAGQRKVGRMRVSERGEVREGREGGRERGRERGREEASEGGWEGEPGMRCVNCMREVTVHTECVDEGVRPVMRWQDDRGPMGVEA